MGYASQDRRESRAREVQDARPPRGPITSVPGRACEPLKQVMGCSHFVTTHGTSLPARHSGRPRKRRRHSPGAESGEAHLSRARWGPGDSARPSRPAKPVPDRPNSTGTVIGSDGQKVSGAAFAGRSLAERAGRPRLRRRTAVSVDRWIVLPRRPPHVRGRRRFAAIGPDRRIPWACSPA